MGKYEIIIEDAVKYEEKLYKLLEEHKYVDLPFPEPKENEKQNTQQLKKYCWAILSILYKQYYCGKCNCKKDEKHYDTIKDVIEGVVKNLEKNNFNQIYIILLTCRKDILDELKKYYKNQYHNYILRKLQLQTIDNQNNMRELLKINPFMIQDSFEFYCNPLTPEEQLIGEILEMKNLSKSKNLNSVIGTLLVEMVKKHKHEKFDEVLMFIICNVYQNAIKNNEQRLINLTKYCIENPKVSNKEIIDYFMDREGNNIYLTDKLIFIIQAFIYYNEKINERDLNKLEKQSSYEYVKNRLKKPN